jgi:hypothetical protein
VNDKQAPVIKWQRERHLIGRNHIQAFLVESLRALGQLGNCVKAFGHADLSFSGQFLPTIPGH